MRQKQFKIVHWKIITSSQKSAMKIWTGTGVHTMRPRSGLWWEFLFFVFIGYLVLAGHPPGVPCWAVALFFMNLFLLNVKTIVHDFVTGGATSTGQQSENGIHTRHLLRLRGNEAKLVAH